MASATMVRGCGSTSAVALVVLFSVLLLLVGFGACTDAQDDNCSLHIPAQEVETLRQIAREVRKPEWNCSADPCSKTPIHNCWNSEDDPLLKYANSINCTCHHGTWHVSLIKWTGQNLTGVLPRSLKNLPYIKTIDLARNVLTGTIPREWADTKLETVSLFANRLSGSIPKSLGSIGTLRKLSIESNRFSGAVPAEFGKLVNLTDLTLSDNKLTGQLPSEFKNLVILRVLRLSSNNFNGSLPDYFEHYSELQNLELVGSGFEGPIPSSISFLRNLRELRIGELKGKGSKFPSLQNLRELNTLVLRNCNITGDIPPYIGYMRKLKDTLDLSFNKMTGSVPYIPAIKDLFLTSNLLNGPIPSWIANTNGYSHIDLSYNNFDDSLVEPLCSRGTLNLYRCNAKHKALDSSACLKRLRCSKARYSLHVNCGGEKIIVGKTTYEQDNVSNGAAEFFRNKAEWGFSSSGEFWRAEVPTNIARNTSMLRMNDTELYREARLAATSLTYYGRCLAKGNYTVTLYFSEIVITDDDSYISNGRRVFDIFIQEKLYVKDFDIVKKANGTNKALKKVFRNIPVTNSIEIRFYYAGKGSTQIPEVGKYGPLISAFSVESQFNPPFDWKIVWQVIIGAISCLFGIAVGVFCWKYRMAKIQSRRQELRVLNPQIGLFTYKQIKAACNNFNAATKLGEGGFGPVYKGTLLDGTLIAVKQLSAKSSQGNREFVNEIGIISSLCHPNLVNLYGCCVDTSQLFLVYEYMENKDLGHALFGSDIRSILVWPTRRKICIGIARGLAFLHEESRIKIVHRDIKATNVLLDGDLNPKISDFGLARLNEEEMTHISTRVAGTIGYMAPEYALWGFLTPKVDVYSFGVVLLEVMAGRSNMKFQPEEHFSLLDWAFVLKQKGGLLELMDPLLGTEYNKEEALMIIQVALLCTNPSPTLRPKMSEALNMLEGNIELQELILEPKSSYEWVYQASKKQVKQISETESQSLFYSSDMPRTDLFSKSFGDLSLSG